jgi:thiamine biosynthesis lipoprotein
LAFESSGMTSHHRFSSPSRGDGGDDGTLWHVRAGLHGVRRVEHLMGMVISVDVRDDQPAQLLNECLDSVFRWLTWVDDTFSTYKPESEISRVGAGVLAVADCCDEVGVVLERCEQLRVETGGYFDAHASGRLDPSGLVKGWAVDRAAAVVAAAGVRNYSINAGGDVLVSGAPEPGRRWQVGIAHPLVGDALCALVALNDGAVATSGIAERGAHVLEPHSGRAALDLASVTVIGDTLGTTDAYATAALAMGLEAPAWLERLRGYASLIVDSGGFLWQSANFAPFRVAVEA